MKPGSKMRINRIVLDNNIWVSYLITKTEDRLLQLIEKNKLIGRFGLSNAAVPNLFGKNGLPVNLFRTDDWN